MPWECADCGPHEIKDAKVVAACHHCGKPLCLAHGFPVRDPAFSATTGRMSAFAHHCDECKREHHSTVLGNIRPVNR